MTTFREIAPDLTQDVNKLTKANTGWGNSSAYTDLPIVAGDKIYFEVLMSGAADHVMVGISPDDQYQTNGVPDKSGAIGLYWITTATSWLNRGTTYVGRAGLAGIVQNDIIGCAFDYDEMILSYYQNGVLLETNDMDLTHGTTPFTGDVYAGVSVYNDTEFLEVYTTESNFTYAIPSGFTALGTALTFDLDTYDGLINSLSPVAYYRLGEASGTVASDSSGNGYDGTYINAPTLGVTGLLVGDADTAIALVEDDSHYVGIGTVGALNFQRNEAYSITGMIKDITSTAGAMFSNYNISGYYLSIDNNKPTLHIINTAITNALVVGTTAAVSGTSHVAVTYDGSSSASGVIIYVDGSPVATTTTYDTLTSDITFASIRLGATSGEYITGTLDEVAIFDSVLTAQNVTDLYTVASTVAGNDPEDAITALSPIAYWKLNDAFNAVVVDYSGNGYDGAWVGVSTNEDTIDDMLNDGVLGVKPQVTEGSTGYMENTAVLAAGDPDTDTYTWIGWVKGFDGTDLDVMSWYTDQSAGTKEYRGKISINSLGDITWQRIYQTGVDPINDIAYQSAATSGLGLVAGTPYLMALREGPLWSEVLVNGVVAILITRVGTSVNDTTYAPRVGIRVGNEDVYINSTTASSYVHSAIYDYEVTGEELLTIYNSFSEVDKTGTIQADQLGQSGTGLAVKTGTLTASGTIVGYQEDALIVGAGGVVTEFISQSASIAATYVSPDNYLVSNQQPQSASLITASTGDPQTYRFSTHGVTTNPTSTPPNIPIAPRLMNAGNYKGDINIKDAGVITPSFGQIVLDNKDGGLDGLVDKAFDGGSYRLYYGPKGGTFPDDFTKVVDTVMGKPSFSQANIKVQLKDRMDFLELPMISNSFSGTGNINGDSTVKGTPKQRVIGRVWSTKVQVIDPIKLVYWVCDDALSSTNATNSYNQYLDNSFRSIPPEWNDSYSSYAYGRVFDGGTQLTNAADYASEADVFAIQPAAGEARWYRPAGVSGAVLIRLGSNPANDVRVDVETTPSGSSKWSVNALLDERPEIVVSAESTNVEIDRGFLIDDTGFTYKDAVREFLKKGYYFARFNRSGEFKVSQVVTPDPAGVSLYGFSESNTASINIGQVTPVWKLFINSGEASSGQVNTGISESRRDEFTESPWHTISSFEQPATRSRHRLAEIASTDIKGWWNQDDIDTHTDNTRVFLMEDRVQVQVSIDRGQLNEATLLLDLGDLVTVVMPRYNFNLGKNFIIHGVRHDYGSGKLTFNLWG